MKGNKTQDDLGKEVSNVAESKNGTFSFFFFSLKMR
jgi:hypothetical protein